MLTSVSVAIIATNVVLTVLDIVIVGLRLLARKSKGQSLSVDDYLIVVALVIVICGCGGYLAAAIVGGIGQHAEDIGPTTVVAFLKFAFALQFPYLLSMACIKLSILLLYRRIFITPRFRTVVSVVSTLVILWLITFFFATLLQEIPISGNWDPSGTEHTINVYAMYVTTSVSDIMLDITILTLPCSVIWRLQIRRAKKVFLSGIFLLGAFVCVAGIVRLYYLINHLNPSNEAEEDLTYNLGDIVVWSSIEPSVGVICACLPTLGPVLNRKALETLISTIRSFFTLHSDHSTDASIPLSFDRAKKTKIDATARPFYPMDDEQSLVTQARGQPDYPERKDHDASGLPSKQIQVDKSFNMEIEGRDENS